MTSYALIFTFCALGISETAYLVKKRLLSQKPVCLIGENCTVVLTSKYSRTFFVPNDLLGLLFYVVCSVITAFLVIGVSPLPFWSSVIKMLVLTGSLFSIYLTYLQMQVIKVWCFWCLMSACTIWLMAVVILLSSKI